MNTVARNFAVADPDLRPILLSMVPLLLVMLLLGGWAIRDGEAIAAMVLLVVTVAVFLALFLSMRRHSVTLDDGQLRVIAGLNSTAVALAELELDKARIVNLDEASHYRPGIRLAGTWFPGYAAGRFIRLDGTRSFALLTSKQRVLVLPHHDSRRRLLLSLQQPQALLDALRTPSPRP